VEGIPGLGLKKTGHPVRSFFYSFARSKTVPLLGGILPPRPGIDRRSAPSGSEVSSAAARPDPLRLENLVVQSQWL